MRIISALFCATLFVACGGSDEELDTNGAWGKAAGPGGGAGATTPTIRVIDDVSIGGVKLGHGEDSVVKLIDEAEEKDELRDWGDGLLRQQWHYHSRGILLQLVKRPGAQQLVVEMIYAGRACHLKTQKGISIGSLQSEVTNAYDEGEIVNDIWFVVSNDRYRLNFRLEDQKVASMQLDFSVENYPFCKKGQHGVCTDL